MPKDTEGTSVTFQATVHFGAITHAIYRIYGLPPVLAGIDVAGGLAGQGDALKEAFNLFLKTKAAPRQRMLAGKIEELMRADGITDFEFVEIEPLITLRPKGPLPLIVTERETTTSKADLMPSVVE